MVVCNQSKQQKNAPRIDLIGYVIAAAQSCMHNLIFVYVALDEAIVYVAYCDVTKKESS